MGFFTNSPINMLTPNPVVGATDQNSFFNWLFGNVGKGQPAYGQPLSPQTSKTILPSVWNSWSPQNAATNDLTQMAGQTNPFLSSMMTWGAPPGSAAGQYASLAAQYGSPSQAGQYESNLAQFGVSSEGAGRPLQDLAYGKTTGPAQFMLPFLLGQNPAAYQAPRIGG